MAFAELLGKSSFSFLRGGSSPAEMVIAAKEHGLTALALCDDNGLYGAARAWVQAKESGQSLIVGAELTLNPAARPVERYQDAELAKRAAVPHDDWPSIALLVRDHVGYTNLCRLLTLAHAGLPKGECVLEREFLVGHSAGLVALAPAPVDRRAQRLDDTWLGPLAELFAPVGALFYAAFRRLDGFDTERMNWVTNTESRFGGQAIASARPLYHHSSRKALTDVLYCIRNGLTLDEAGARLSANAEAALCSEEQMRRLFREREAWVDRTAEVAQELSFQMGQLEYQFPCGTSLGDADVTLASLTWEGAEWRYGREVPAPVKAQLEKELALISKLRVAPYFLSTREIVQIAREKRILCQGRGSAANSAVCYVLGITSVDPARTNLLFERFMSAERAEPPDIDVDFEHERREEVIQEIYRRYGRERAAMVSEVISYRGKSALREVGKVFGLSLEQVTKLSGSITFWDDANAAARRVGEAGLDTKSARVRRVLGLVQQLVGFPRHLSIHVGGFVLSAAPLNEVAPIEPARMEGRSVIPWDKDDLEVLGFFKIDVLALGMLTAIRKCLERVAQDEESVLNGGRADSGASLPATEAFDPVTVMGRLPAEDPHVYAMLCRADTVGVFQIESRAQMAMLPRLRPQKFYDLVVEVAIVRPGPIQGGMVHPYLRRRNREELPLVPHPKLEPILERTLGVPLFQEQVMQIAIEGAGYSGGEADQLRRDMAAWKKSGNLLRHREKLLAGFAKTGIARSFGEALFEQIKGFGDYGFPESHAASFALLVYVSSWLKAYFPAHFTAALLNSQPMGFYSPSSLIKDAQKHGVEVRAVDVLRSDWDSTLEAAGNDCQVVSKFASARRAIRLGFRQLKGFRQASATALTTARKGAPFTSVEEMRKRVTMPKDEWDVLAEAGAFASLGLERRHALWKLRAPRVAGLFAESVALEPSVALPALKPGEQLFWDYEHTGLSLHDHPIRHFANRLVKVDVCKATGLDTRGSGTVNVAGMVLSRQRPATASGIVFITLEDETGVINLVVYSRVYEKYRLAAQHASLLLARGRLERHVTPARPSEVGESTPVIHVIVEHLERLDVPGRDIRKRSRDFH